MYLPHRLLIAALLTPMLMSTAVLAQSTNRQIGTQFEVTADPLVPRPHGQPCVVTLFSNYTFAFFFRHGQDFSIHSSLQLFRPLEEDSP